MNMIVKKRVSAVLLTAIVLVSLSACASLDVVGTDSVRAFEEVIDTLEVNPRGEFWTFTSPDGDAELHWNKKNAEIRLNMQPFIDAGLDITQRYDAGERRGNDWWCAFDMPAYENFSNNYSWIDDDSESSTDIISTPMSDFKRLISKRRNNLGYHMALDHYNLSFGFDNMFEWAKDLSVNSSTKENQDKDIVFVLNPEPLIAAGVDPERVEGWVYAQVPIEENGKTIQVWKLLKPFDLK